MELSTWFDYQLRSTLDGFMWSVRQLPAERFYNIPPVSLGLGEWSAAQHVFHMLQYEEGLVLPSMLQWLGGPPVTRRENQSEDLPPIEATLAQFERIRHEEIALLTKFSQEIWESKQKTTFWGEVSLAGFEDLPTYTGAYARYSQSESLLGSKVGASGSGIVTYKTCFIPLS